MNFLKEKNSIFLQRNQVTKLFDTVKYNIMTKMEKYPMIFIGIFIQITYH